MTTMADMFALLRNPDRWFLVPVSRLQVSDLLRIDGHLALVTHIDRHRVHLDDGAYLDRRSTDWVCRFE